MNVHLTVQMPYAVPHALDADAGAASLNGSQFLVRNSFSVIPDFQSNPVWIPRYFNFGGVASGVTQDVSQTLLHHAEQCQFTLRRQPSEVFGNAQLHFQGSTLREAIHIQSEGGWNSALIEERRMQQVRGCANLLRDPSQKFPSLGEFSGKLGLARSQEL